MHVNARSSEVCNSLAVRQAARHVTQFYDRYLAPCGVRTTQFSILAMLRRQGPMDRPPEDIFAEPTSTVLELTGNIPRSVAALINEGITDSRRPAPLRYLRNKAVRGEHHRDQQPHL